MSLTDKKVSDALLQTGVVSAPDKLAGTAAENKAVFDRLMRNIAQSVINPVIDELVGIEGANNIGTPEGSVQQRLDSASDHIGNRDNPHNVTPAQIGAETPMEAQNKVNEALSQAKQYAETEIRKHIAQSGAVIADGKGNAENANALNGIPGENYLPEKITDLTGAKSYEYAAPMACVARPSFIGRTVQEGTPGPDSPAPIKGVLNPWVAAYSGGLVEVPAGVEPLMALPDGTADRIVLRDGAWGIERKLICDNLLDAAIMSSGFFASTGMLRFTVWPSKSFVAKQELADCVLCNCLQPVNRNIANNIKDYSHIAFGGGGAYIVLDIAVSEFLGWSDDWTEQQKKDTFVAWIQEMSFEVWGQSVSPAFEPVPAWNIYGKIAPITVTTSITKPDPDAPISPDNMATITGTPVVTTGYRGKAKQLKGDLFEDDGFDGVNFSQKKRTIMLNGTENWRFMPTMTGAPEFYIELPDAKHVISAVRAVARCNLFLVRSADELYAEAGHGLAIVQRDLDMPIPRLTFFLKEISNLEAWKAKLAEWTALRQPLEVVYELAAPTITRHDLDLALSPGNWTIEAGDENGLLESMDISVLPDSAVYGRRVYPYQHMKEGTVHKLTGTPGAEQIIFNATDVYQDGDTWMLNGAAVSVTYNDGQALLPTAVIAGDVVEAVVEGGVLRLMLQKPTPQKGLEINGDFRQGHLQNQRGQAIYSSSGYTIDMWQAGYSVANGGSVAVSDEGVMLTLALDSEMIIWQTLENKIKDTSTLTAEVDGKIYFIASGPLADNDNCRINITNDMFLIIKNKEAVIGISGKAAAHMVSRIKFEPGPRFTGWYEPKPGETLAECQRYFTRLKYMGGNTYQTFGAGTVDSATRAVVFVPLPVQMRTMPRISFSGNIKIRGSGSWHTVKSFDDTTLSTTGATILVSVEGSGLATGGGVIMEADGDMDAYLDFDANMY